MSEVDVVKLGGAAGIGGDRLLDDVAAAHRDGARIVLVHGGSDETNRLAEALGHPPRFVTSESGFTSRVTDARTLEIFIMATAVVNRRITAGLIARGVRGVGLSGLDGRLIEGRRKEAIRVVENGRRRVLRDDWTGTPTTVDGAFLTSLLDAGLVPVIAPLAVSDRGEPLNVDGDRVAAAVAAALAARTLVLLTNVAGLLADANDAASLIARVPWTRIDEAAACAEGRMKKKVLGAREALEAGVGRVVIGDARVERPLTRALAGEGTVLLGPAPSRGVEVSA